MSFFINKHHLDQDTLNIEVPSDIFVIQQAFNLSAYHKDLFKFYDIDCPNTIEKSVKKRQAEYLAGRYVAKLALEKVGIINTPILTGKHRNPLWPEGISASITHTNNIALCMATNSNRYTYIGIDVEEKLPEETVFDIKNSIINKNEEALILKNTENFSILFSIIFSAKESLFKALYASVGYYFDFSAAEVFDISIRQKQLKVKLTEDLSSQLMRGKEFIINFTFNKNHVTTFIYS